MITLTEQLEQLEAFVTLVKEYRDCHTEVMRASYESIDREYETARHRLAQGLARLMDLERRVDASVDALLPTFEPVEQEA